MINRQELQQTVLNPISGRLLRDFILDGYLRLISPNYVSNTAQESIIKIKERYGCIPDSNGYNNVEICNYQNLLFEHSGGLPYVYAFVITAPHTHWDSEMPITYHYEFDKNRYLIGPREITDNRIYTPVSFIFTQFGVLPYEWADDSVIINDNEFKSSIIVLQKIFSGLREFPSCFGVSINFRFKTSLYDFPLISIEHPIDGISEKNELAEILLVNDYENKYGDEQVEQVAWTSIPENSIILNDDEEEIYSIILNSIDMSMSDSDKIKHINKILKESKFEEG